MEIDSIFENVKYVGANEKKTNVSAQKIIQPASDLSCRVDSQCRQK